MGGLSEGELKLQARVVGAARGVRWLAEGWRFFRAAPLGWLTLAFSYLFLIATLSWRTYPMVGTAIVLAATPLSSVVFMTYARAVDRGVAMPMRSLIEGFRPNWLAQLVLGIFYLACVAAIAVATGFASEVVPGAEVPAETLVVLAALYLPVAMLFWFAPTLAAWHSAGVAKALFFSFMAFLMNWRAFLAYGAVTAVTVFALTALIVVAARLISPGISPASLALPMFIAVFPMLSGSYYASYRDVFAEPTAGPT